MATKPSTVSRDKFTDAQDMAFLADMRLKLAEFVASNICTPKDGDPSLVSTSKWEWELLMFSIHQTQEAVETLHTFVATEAQA